MSTYSSFDTFSKLSKTERFEAIKLLVKSLDLGEVESFVVLLDDHLAKPTVQTKAEVIEDDDCQEINEDVDNVHESNDIRPRLKGKLISKSSEKKLFSCGKCGESFSSVNSHLMHIKQFKCKEVSDKQFRDESKFKKSHTCAKCLKTFSNANRLKAHNVVHTGERPFSCDNCDKTFASSGSRYNHMKRFHDGEKPFVCDICYKSWAIKIDLVLHRKIHTREKPHTCPFCRMKFSRSSSLVLHKKVHTHHGLKSLKPLKSIHIDENPIPCSVCQKLSCFPELHQKMRQKNLSRQKTSKPSAFCTVCKKTFFNARSLYRHNMLHSGQKSYSCENCGKAFIQKSNLKYHMKTAHLKNNDFLLNPFSCISCKKSFCSSSSLNRHNKLHTGERPYSCELCGKTFIQTSNLKYHMKTAHIEEK